MKYKLGKKYESPKPNNVNAILASLFATFQVAILLTLTLFLCLGLSIVLDKLWYLNIVVLLFALLWIPFIYYKCMYRSKVVSVELYKVLCAVMFAFIAIPISFSLLSNVVLNVNEDLFLGKYHIRGIVETSKQSFSFVTKSYNIYLGEVKLSIPAFLTVLATAAAFIFLEFRILSLRFKDILYIESDKMMYVPQYQFTLVDKINRIEMLSYEYLRTLDVDETGNVVANRIYYDVYTYGENEEQYFFIEYYMTKMKNNKVVESKRKLSPIYAFDISRFDEHGSEFSENALKTEDTSEAPKSEQNEIEDTRATDLNHPKDESLESTEIMTTIVSNPLLVKNRSDASNDGETLVMERGSIEEELVTNNVLELDSGVSKSGDNEDKKSLDAISSEGENDTKESKDGTSSKGKTKVKKWKHMLQQRMKRTKK